MLHTVCTMKYETYHIQHAACLTQPMLHMICSTYSCAIHSSASDPENTIIPKIFIHEIGVDITSFE